MKRSLLGLLVALGCSEAPTAVDTGVAGDAGVRADAGNARDAGNGDVFDGGEPDRDGGELDLGPAPRDELAGRADFPMVAPEARALSVAGDTVVDAITGRTWQRSDSGTALTWADAEARCSALPGASDWRLPSRVELASILDATRSPTLDTAIFAETPAEYFWTASLAVDGTDRAYAIYFGQGETVLAQRSLAGAFVRCVRGERGSPQERRIDDGWLVDDDLGLAVALAPEPATTRADAAARCAGRDARLPTLYELHAWVAEGARPALPEAIALPEGPVWSSTERDFGEILAWTLDFTEGTSDLSGTGQRRPALCVRDGG